METYCLEGTFQKTWLFAQNMKSIYAEKNFAYLTNLSKAFEFLEYIPFNIMCSDKEIWRKCVFEKKSTCYLPALTHILEIKCSLFVVPEDGDITECLFISHGLLNYTSIYIISMPFKL